MLRLLAASGLLAFLWINNNPSEPGGYYDPPAGAGSGVIYSNDWSALPGTHSTNLTEALPDEWVLHTGATSPLLMLNDNAIDGVASVTTMAYLNPTNYVDEFTSAQYYEVPSVSTGTHADYFGVLLFAVNDGVGDWTTSDTQHWLLRCTNHATWTIYERGPGDGGNTTVHTYGATQYFGSGDWCHFKVEMTSPGVFDVLAFWYDTSLSTTNTIYEATGYDTGNTGWINGVAAVQARGNGRTLLQEIIIGNQ